MSNESRNAIGIDLGTANSCVAVFMNGKVEIILNEHGTKRLIGRTFEDPCVQSDMKHWPFKVCGTDDGRPMVEVQFKGEKMTFTAEEIAAMILAKMKESAEVFLGCAVEDVVVTVPAYFNASQRRFTRDAAAIAGLNVQRVIAEPIAIGLGLDRRGRGEMNVLIFNLGGGMLDVAILAIEDGIYDVKAVAGDTHLGGEDFDTRLVNHFVAEFKRKYKKDLASNPRSLRRLRTACERAKRALSSASEATIEIDYLFEAIDFYTKITRDRFEELCADLFRSTLDPVMKCLSYARMDKSYVDEIVLVGGSGRIPKVHELLSVFFSGKKLNRSVNPDAAAAYGAALQGAWLSRDQSEALPFLLDVAPLPIGIETVGGEMTVLVKRNTTIPTKTSQSFTINAIKEEIDSDGDENIPHGRFLPKKILPVNADDHNEALIKVYEGVSLMTKDNNLLGEFTLPVKPPKAGGEARIEVIIDIDCFGIVDVTAVDKSSGNQKKITIQNEKGRLSEAEVERMIDEAKQYKAEGDKQKERIRAKNSLESYVFKMKQTIEDKKLMDKLSAGDWKRIKDKCDEVMRWLDENQNAEQGEFEYQQKMIEGFCNPILTKMYQSTGGAPGAKRKVPTENDEPKRKRAKNSLECHVFMIKQTIANEKLKETLRCPSTIHEEKRKKMEEKCEEVINWLKDNQTADQDEYGNQKKNLEIVCNPIIMEMFQAGSGRC